MRDANAAVERAAMQQVLPPDLFSSFLAISADAVIAVDEEQHIIFFNEGAERIFGWSAAEVGGKYLAMLLPERFRAQHRGHVTITFQRKRRERRLHLRSGLKPILHDLHISHRSFREGDRCVWVGHGFAILIDHEHHRQPGIK